jgi:spoIIIJ-associated protein
LLREVIKEAETIEEAKNLAAEALGMPGAELQFEILQLPQKKTLGLFGGSPARVRAYFKISPAQQAAEYLKEILVRMGVPNPEIKIIEGEKGSTLEISGDNLGVIIGRRGETLDALQYLAGLVANRVDNSYYRITLNIGNYREKREQSLIGLAKKIARGAAKTGRKTSLEPMNPYERRIIHTAVQEVKGATSWSVGEEPYRHVIIGPSEDNPGKRSGRGGRKKPSKKKSAGAAGQQPAADAERAIREFIPRSNPLPTVDGATPPARTMSEKEESSSLYGRLDL